jgi:hypothetical protein
MNHPLDGVHERLERANENIRNLKSEIEAFLEDGTHPIIANEDATTIQEAVDFHASRVVPLRFSVLGGEIIHHLRSCLDHIAWQLSSKRKRSKDPTGIEFPIFSSKPTDENAISRYERKIEGISQPGRNIIEGLQPYHRQPAMLTGPRNHPLWIIHDMDRIDKHRELIITIGAFDIRVTGMASIRLMLSRYANFPEGDIAGLTKTLDPNCKVTPQISFRDFGGRKIQPVIPGLVKLTDYVGGVAKMFSDECF